MHSSCYWSCRGWSVFKSGLFGFGERTVGCAHDTRVFKKKSLSSQLSRGIEGEEAMLIIRNYRPSSQLPSLFDSSSSSSSSLTAAASSAPSLLSSLVTRPLVLSLFSATCSNRPSLYSHHRLVSAATMSTVAIPQQHHHHHQHPPPPPHVEQPDSPKSASDSETPSSSRKSSRSGSRSRRSKDSTRQQPGLQRMSGYFPLGYKDAAYQWVCRSRESTSYIRPLYNTNLQLG